MFGFFSKKTDQVKAGQTKELETIVQSLNKEYQAYVTTNTKPVAKQNSNN